MIAAVPERFRRLVEAPPGAELRGYTDLTNLEPLLTEVEVLWMDLWSLTAVRQVVAKAGCLRWLSTHGAGTDNLPHEQLRSARVTVTNAAGLQAEAVAEFAVLLMLVASTGIRGVFTAMAERRWPGPFLGRTELSGDTALLLGSGEVGRALVKRLKGLGMIVVSAGRSQEPDRLPPDEWRNRLGEFDWVILTAALTPSTRHLIGAPELRSMGRQTRLVNVARGGLIDEAALIEALAAGSIKGACLDVTESEPPAPDSPLWDLPNVVLTPHMAGYSADQDTRASELFSRNLDRFISGQPLSNTVNLEAGY